MRGHGGPRGPGGFGGGGPGFGGPGFGPGFGPPGMWGGPWGGPWGPPPFLWGFWWGPDWWRCPGLPLLLFLILWGVIYSLFAVVEFSECGSGRDPMCASTYGIAAGVIFFVLAIIYLACMLFAIRPPPPPGSMAEHEALLSKGEHPSPSAPPVVTVTVEKV